MVFVHYYRPFIRDSVLGRPCLSFYLRHTGYRLPHQSRAESYTSHNTRDLADGKINIGLGFQIAGA